MGAHGESAQRTARWDELDLLRGIAGVLMVTNHAGYKWLDEGTLADPVVSALVFAGSCAPVVFFTTSGIGYGLQVGKGRAADARALLRKVAILLVADAMLWSAQGAWFGLDFLGFIGLSMLVLDPLRRARRAVPIAIAGIAAITVLRYGVGEAVKAWPTPLGGALRVALGVDAIEHVSYPLLPWLAYPLTGFVLGALASRGRAAVEQRFAAVIAFALATIAACSAASAWIVHGGRALHRWGYVSLAFYAASFAAIAAAVALALVLGRVGGTLARRLFELRGVASLALVPWHYAVIIATAAVLDVHAFGRSAWLIGTLAMIVASFALSRRTELVAAEIGARASAPGRTQAVLVVAVALVFLLELVLTFAVPPAPIGLVVALVVSGQVLLCVVFALPAKAVDPRSAI